MNSPFYDLVRNMWILGSITREEVGLMVPEYITQEEHDEILEMEQDGVIPIGDETQG